MPKICFLCPTVLLKRPISDIIEKLTNDYKNHNIKLITPNDVRKGIIETNFKIFKKVEIKKYLTLNIPFLSSEWPIPLNPLFLISLLKCILNSDYIHMWVPFYISHTLLAIFKKLFFPKKKLFITMDTIPGHSFKMGKILNKMFYIYYKSIGKLVFSAADKIIIYADSMKKFVLRAGIPKEKIIILPTGVDLNKFEQDIDIRKEFNIINGENLVLYIGLLNNRKGIDTIIKSAKKLRDLNIKFIIVGDGPKRRKFEKLTKNFKLNNVIFTGFRNDVHNFYQVADIFFFPSRGEGLAGVIMESMIYGVPVISSDIPGIRDLIINKENGFLCKCEDIESYSKNIIRLLNDKFTRERFINKSREKIIEKFDWKKNIVNFVLLYYDNYHS